MFVIAIIDKIYERLKVLIPAYDYNPDRCSQRA